ncbi:MAG TPA: hypothetical protein VFY40_07475 [Blastocatellia bacterium]|nr:hypothetical protein [Blastocatellia bacterium]
MKSESILDLKQEDFEILEDGVPQEIAKVFFHSVVREIYLRKNFKNVAQTGGGGLFYSSVTSPSPLLRCEREVRIAMKNTFVKPNVTCDIISPL